MEEKLSHTIAGGRLSLKKMALVLLVILGIASATIIVVNYYSVRVLSGARAYINGESQYSKAQKDASADLVNYIYLGNDSNYTAFLNNIKVPIGDRKARLALSSTPVNYDAAKLGFLQGGNHPEDVDDLIWVFVRFHSLPKFKQAIGIWRDADAMINDLNRLGLQAREKISNGTLSALEKRSLLLAVSDNSAKMTIKEEMFSATLGDICRSINVDVFFANVLITIVIVISALLFAGIMIRNLANSKKKIIEQNDNLQVINAGLDKFVFNVTHDLRSPLASLSGLIGLINRETDLKKINAYTLMMKGSLEKQDKFINEMLTFIKSKHSGVAVQLCNLTDIVDTVIAQNSYSDGGGEVKFYKELEVANVESDALKLQVILNNLVSNSVKYSDSKKPERWIKVKTYRSATETVIEVADNGLGIRKIDQECIFDKFYMSGDNKRSSGIGLYLVMDAVTQLNGKIEVRSEPGVSSTFMVRLPFRSQ